MNILLISGILNYRTLAGASGDNTVHYILSDRHARQFGIEQAELDRLNGKYRKHLRVHYVKGIFFLNAFKRAYGILSESRIDLLLTTSPLIGLMCLVFKIFLKKPYAIFVGQPFTEYIINERPFYYRLLLPFYKMAMFISFRNADVITTHSRYLQNYVRHYGGRNVVGTYFYGVDTQAFRPMKVARQKKFTVMYAGRFSKQKGVDHLLEAFRTLKRRGLDFTAWMYGQGPLREELASKAKESALDLNIYGYTDQKTLARKMNEADVFVVPSISEGLGFIAAEALACGVPVVASNAGGLPDIVEGYGILVAPKDADELADAIMEVRDNRREYRIKALQGRKHILEKFEQKKVFKEFNDALESAVHGK
jgi:glycosyltransferase involved in cell wall biosynthesis